MPVCVIKSNTVTQIENFLRAYFFVPSKAREEQAVREAEQGVQQLLRNGAQSIELAPQGPVIRRLQHQIAEQHQLRSRSMGTEPRRRVLIFKD